ncbi:MAG: SPOR domain-containing protein [bacterium]|nr:SPOR domain-containing protein [bacterium]
MKRTTFGKAAVASLLVATTMVGCTGAAFRTSSAAAVKQKSDPAKFASLAEKALADKDGARAVDAAEAAVRGAPDNAAYRQLLGRSYIAAGRFASAESALTDAMTLGNTDARTVINLALVQVALGQNEAARTLLASHADTVPATDYGLALAMAGDAPTGVGILAQAIQDPSATARTRQNLAYAYALAGRWKDARMVAGMDLDPLAANQRISQWAMMAEPSLAPQRVAALMGVTVNGADAGQPVALALAPAAAPVAMAQASPDILPPPATADAAPVQMASIDPAPPSPVIETAEAAPVIRADPKPARVVAHKFIVEGGSTKSSSSRTVKTAATAPTPSARMQTVAFAKPVGTGASNWVVQLGAYDTAAIAKDKWMTMARVNGAIAAFPVLTSQATIKGKAYHRLAISGFGNRTDAAALCRSIQAQHGQCFVREGAPNATPQRWAVASKGRQFASR